MPTSSRKCWRSTLMIWTQRCSSTRGHGCLTYRRWYRSIGCAGQVNHNNEEQLPRCNASAGCLGLRRSCVQAMSRVWTIVKTADIQVCTRWQPSAGTAADRTGCDHVLLQGWAWGHAWWALFRYQEVTRTLLHTAAPSVFAGGNVQPCWLFVLGCSVVLTQCCGAGPVFSSILSGEKPFRAMSQAMTWDLGCITTLLIGAAVFCVL